MNLVLDLVGKLITCEARQTAVLGAALICCGAQIDLHQVWELKRAGTSTENAMVQLGLVPELARRVISCWRHSIEDPIWLGLDSVQTGVFDVLSDMKRVGGRVLLLTARSHPEWVSQQLARLGLLPMLDNVTVVTPSEAVQGKIAMLRAFSATAFFGDTELDWLASIRAEVPFFPVSWGQRSEEYLARAVVGVSLIHADLASAWKTFAGPP